MARDGYRIFDAGIQAAVFLGFRGYFEAYVATLSQTGLSHEPCLQLLHRGPIVLRRRE